LANRSSGFDVITSAHSCSNTGSLESSNGVGNFVSQRVLDTEDSCNSKVVLSLVTSFLSSILVGISITWVTELVDKKFPVVG
jgi:hypothetical protein